MNTAPQSCPVCQQTLQQGVQDWHFLCPTCGYEAGRLQESINLHAKQAKIDEAARAQGLHKLRTKNMTNLLNAVCQHKPAGGKLLEVGCAHGWFLDQAQERGFDVLGIEPDKAIHAHTVKRHPDTRCGFFPAIMAAQERFDVIVFNDVFEHIPDSNAILAACHAHLAPDGLLLINLPCSSGFFYRTAFFLARFGARSFFDRLWQKDFPSPHLHYFNRPNLQRLLGQKGFRTLRSGTLASIAYSGLWERISHTDRQTDRQTDRPVYNYLVFIVVALLIPVLRILPADIFYILSQRKNDHV